MRVSENNSNWANAWTKLSSRKFKIRSEFGRIVLQIAMLLLSFDRIYLNIVTLSKPIKHFHLSEYIASGVITYFSAYKFRLILIKHI